MCAEKSNGRKSLKRILYVEGCRDGTVGGSHSCLWSMVANLDRSRFLPIVFFYSDNVVCKKLRSIGVRTFILKNEKQLNIAKYRKNFLAIIDAFFPPLITFQRLINFLWFFIRPTILYIWYIMRLRIDIVHLNNSVNSNHTWMMAAKLSRVKIITHERGFNTEFMSYSHYMGNRLDAIICISKKIFENLKEHGFFSDKLKLVYDGIDTQKATVTIDKDVLREKYNIQKEDNVIGVIGNIKEWKGQEIVIQATAILKKKLSNIKCLLVGGFVHDDPYKKRIEKIIQELDVSDNIILAGFQECPANFMNVMDVVVHSSIAPEPFGMVNLEAMFLKKPIISTNIGGPTEIFTDGENGRLISPGDPNLLAVSLISLLQNAEFRHELGANAYKTVVTRFRIEDTVAQIQKIYEEI